MARDLFKEYGVDPSGGMVSPEGRDLFAERGIAAGPDTSSWYGRLGAGVADMPLGISQLIARVNPSVGHVAPQIDKEIAEREKAYQASRGENAGSFDVMRGLGNVASSLPLTALIPGGSTIPRAVLSGAAAGGGAAALQPVTQNQDSYWTEKGRGTLYGAGFGGVAGGLFGALQKMISPEVSGGAAEMYGRGRPVTYGATGGRSGLEAQEALKHYPGVSKTVVNAERRALDGWNREVVNEALKPLGKAISDDVPVGQPLMEKANSLVTDAFNSAWRGKKVTLPDTYPMLADLPRDISMLSRPAAQQFESILKAEGVAGLKGELESGAVKTMLDKLREHAKTFGGSTDANQKLMGGMFQKLYDAIEGAALASNAEIATGVSAAKNAWANMLSVNRGAAKDIAEGVMTPKSLASAVSGEAFTNNQLATGSARMQEMAKLGLETMGPRVGQPVAADRMMGFTSLARHPFQATRAYSSWPLYTQGGENAALALMQRPEYAGLIAELLRRSSPALSAGSAAAMTPALTE